MSEIETHALNGDGETANDEDGKADLVKDAKEEENAETVLGNGGNGETEERNPEQQAIEEINALPVVIDDLAELGVEWLLTKSEEGTGNWGKEYETSEVFENVDDGQLDIEAPPPMPDVSVSNHGQTMHLVPPKDDGRTSTTLTWIRKTSLRKDSASDRRITVRGLSFGDLFHPRIYTLIQLGQSIDYASTERTLGSTCSVGILTINYRTILDRLVALRRYLLDIEIPGRRLEIVCTFPDHKRPPEFETLWQAYSIEGVPPCASQRADREILAKQIVLKNIPAGCDEEQIRKYFGSLCDEVEFMDDYNSQRCAIVTFVDIVNCHVAHARQNDIVFENGTRPQVYLMTDMIANSKLMPKRVKEESEEERHLRHTFELLWNHQQRITNAMHRQDRYGGRTGNDFQSRRILQTITKKLPTNIRQQVEERAHERKTKEVVEKEAEKVALAAEQDALKDQRAEAKAEQDAKNGEAPIPLKRSAEESPAEAQKRPRKKNFRGAGGNIGMQRRGMSSAGGGNRRDASLYYQRGDHREPMHRGLMSPNANPAGRYGGGGGYVGEMRASPWIVPPGAGATAFERHPMDMPGSYGSPPAALMSRRDLPLDHSGGPLFASPSGGMPYGGQGAGYIAREMEMRRSGGGELYQRRDALGPEFQRADYRGFYGKR